MNRHSLLFQRNNSAMLANSSKLPQGGLFSHSPTESIRRDVLLLITALFSETNHCWGFCRDLDLDINETLLCDDCRGAVERGW